jgi:hypothetical protein
MEVWVENRGETVEHEKWSSGVGLTFEILRSGGV